MRCMQGKIYLRQLLTQRTMRHIVPILADADAQRIFICKLDFYVAMIREYDIFL